MSLIDDTKKIEAFDALFYEVIGGQEVATMMSRHHIDGASYRTLAHEHDMPEATVRTRLARARTTLRRLGLMPIAWEKPPQAILEPSVGTPKK